MFCLERLITRSSIVQREHEHSRSLEHSNISNNSSVDKQSRSFDAVHLLRPVVHRDNVVTNRRTNSYETSDDCPTPVAPPPIIIKIPDMRELVQAAQLSQYENYCFNIDQTSADELSPDLFTSTSIDSAGAMAIEQNLSMKNNEDDPLKYEHRRKSSSNLLLPPAEVRRQALRRTFEKRRRCIDQSNAKRDEQDNSSSSTKPSTDFSSLFNNFNSKSENSSFDRSLETDFDVQSDASSRGPNDQFTSIESSGNENALPDLTQRLIIDDSGFKSIESQNQTISLDWMSADTETPHIYSNEEQFQFNRNSMEQPSGSPRNKLITSTSFIRTASKRRREFGKDKRYANSNVVLPHSTIPDEYRSPLNISPSVKFFFTLFFQSFNEMFFRLMKINNDLSRHYKFDIQIFVEQNLMKEIFLVNHPQFFSSIQIFFFRSSKPFTS